MNTNNKPIIIAIVAVALAMLGIVAWNSLEQVQQRHIAQAEIERRAPLEDYKAKEEAWERVKPLHLTPSKTPEELAQEAADEAKRALERKASGLVNAAMELTKESEMNQLTGRTFTAQQKARLEAIPGELTTLGFPALAKAVASKSIKAMELALYPNTPHPTP